MPTKLMISLLFATTLCLFGNGFLFAQPKNAKLAQWTSKNSTDQWLEFKPNHPLKVNDLIHKQKELLGLQTKDQFLVKKVAQDALGFTHHRLQQTYNNIPIEGTALLIHEKNQHISLANGQWIRGLNITTNPTLSKQTALQFALNKVPATEYAWQNEHYELIIQDSKADPTATFYPKGELVIASADLRTQKATNYHLAYKFDIYATQPLNRLWVYVDAHTGQIVNTISQLCDMDVAGTGEKTYGCAHTVDLTCHDNGNFYQLKEAGRGSGIETYTCMNDYSYPPFLVASSDAHFEEDPVAVEAHWGTEQVYDYYLSEHGRNSFDGNGAKLKSWVHYGQNYNNAFWNGSFMTYGDGDGTQFTPLVSLDVVGHEIAHGVTNYSADLVYSYEPGALNESFSDIFGALIEFYADPDCADWSIGEDITPNGNGIRNMQTPNLHNQPDTYMGDFWFAGSGDNGGVHYNSGVQNFWFYLLSEGGNGTNDNGDDYMLTGIGRDKAAAIAYRNLTTYLTATSEYADARSGAIQAAIDLYGAGSTEVLQTTLAWCAVGVGFCQETNKTLTLMAPNGGEIWEQGTTQPISWTSNGTIEEVELEYSLNNGGTWTTISTATANDGTYDWLIPNVSSTIALVKITEVADNTVMDESDATFIIKGCEANAYFEVASTTICVGETVVATNTSTGATAYEWQIDAVMEGSQTDFSYTFTEAGTYILILIATNGNNCSDSYSEVITVEAVPTATFNYSVDGLTAHCFADFDGAMEYSWTFGDGGVVIGESVSYTYVVGGEYEVCLSVEGDCGVSNSCETVNVVDANECGEESWRHYLNGGTTNPLLEVGEELFVGTRFGGLVKINLNTNETVFYDKLNSDLPSNNGISALLEGSNGDIFVGTEQGLMKFDGVNPTGWTTYTTNNSDLPSDGISALLETGSGDIFVGTTAGLAKFDGVSSTGWILYNTNNSDLPSDGISALLETGSGDIFVGTAAGLAKFDGENSTGWTIYTTDNSDLPKNYVITMLESSIGDIFISTGRDGGLAKFDGESATGWTTYTTDNSDLPNNSVIAMLESSIGDIFIGTGNGGLAKFDGESATGWTIYNTNNSDLPSGFVTAILESSSEEIFVGTTAGLAKFDGENSTDWVDYNTSSSDLPIINVEGSLETINGDIFIGTVNGLAKFDGESATGWTIYTTDNSDLPSGFANVILESNSGEIFVGTGDGLAKFDGESATGWITYTIDNSDLPRTGFPYDLLESSSGEIFMGTGYGLVKFDGESATGWTIYTTDNSDLPDRSVRAILESSSGEIFVGTGDGLAKFDGESATGWTIYTTDNSDLPNGFVRTILESSSGEIFVGTGDGLAKFDGESTTGWTIYTTDNSGLSSSSITCLLENSNKDIFVGGYGGLNVLTPNQNISPTASFTLPTTTCRSTPTTFPNTSTNATTYEWQVDGITVSTDTDLTYTFPTAGNYMVTLIASNGDCTDFYQELVRIHNNAHVLDVGVDQYMCAETLILDAQVSDMAAYFWDFEGTNVGNEQTYTATQSGVYTLSVIDSCGNAAFDEIEILLDDNCVWPGDYNDDNIVNNHDLLRVGLAFGEMGPQRPNATLSWEAQACPNWDGNYAPNLKHTDGDGNGVIDLNDQQAIRTNYGKTHGTPPTLPPSTSPLTLTAFAGEAPPSFGENTILQIDIHLANNDEEDSNSSLSAYGIAFDIDYIIPDAIQVNHVYFQAANSWLGTASYDMMTLDHHAPFNHRSGNLAVALCRTDRQNRTSYGRIGTVIAEVDILPTLDTIRDVAVELSEIEMVINNGISIVGGQGQSGSYMNLANSQADFNLTTAPLLTQLQLHAFLPHVYQQATSTMSPMLRQQNQLPTQQPFNTAPWFYAGDEGVNQLNDLPDDMVDWVLVEVQNELGQVLTQKAVALLADGTIADVQAGIDLNTVALAGLENNQDYYILLRHRHHMDVVSVLPLTVTDLTLTMDFSDLTQVMGGAAQLMDMGNGQYGLIAGDANGDGIINVQDFNAYRNEQVQSNTYSPCDFNLDGQLTIDDFNAYQDHASHIGVSRVRY